ncbi:MAG: hypothetical protein ACRESZ_00325 [Methylococcales bacterium]
MQYFSTIRMGLYFAIGFAFQGPVLAENKYPAAYFEPYIVYRAPEIAGQPPADSQNNAAAQTAAEPEAEDPYPAAYFQPVILYQDKELIAARTEQPAAEPEPAPGEKPAASAKKGKSPAATPAPASERGGVPVGALFLLVALAGGLYWVIFKKKDASEQVALAETNGSARSPEPSSDEPPEPSSDEPAGSEVQEEQPSEGS